ncbi:MAG TPA: type IX secretion system membrane protein PorP/SprF [Bacteroidales bacterium]|nr:type IX secretion system membrane protein PorP/SprF [Bacteroidales bacterium]
MTTKAMIKRAGLVSIIIIISLLKSAGQQLPVYSQYMMNAFLVNPAVAGHEGYTAINLTAREQWLGLKDAPGTYAVSAQTRLLKNSYISRSASIRKRKRVMSRSGRVGHGLYAFTDMSGAFSRTGIQGTYSYHIPLDKSQLSFGVSLTGYQFSINDANIRLLDENDELLMNTERSAFVPDANFGVYYTDQHLYAGISAMQLFQSPLKVGADNDGPGYKMLRHYFLTAGYRFEIGRDVLLEPSFLLKATGQFIAQADVNLKMYINENYWAGVSYRTGGSYGLAEESMNGKGSAAVIMGGIKVDKYYIGYSFDYTFNALGARTLGSHEIMAAVKFGDNARRYRWLNRY